MEEWQYKADFVVGFRPGTDGWAPCKGAGFTRAISVRHIVFLSPRLPKRYRTFTTGLWLHWPPKA